MCITENIYLQNIYKTFTKQNCNSGKKPHSNRDPTEKEFNGLFLMFILLPVLTITSRQDLQTGNSTMLYLRTER